MAARSFLKFLHSAALFIVPRPVVLWLEEEYFRRNGEKELFLVEHLCRPHQDAIDVGGNVGCYSLFMRKYARRVISFEPIPWMAKRLARKFGAGVTVREMALSSVDGTALLHIPILDGAPVTALSSLRADKSAQGRDITVRTARLDDVYDGQVGLIKIDVEGHEEAVLDGAKQTIARCRPRFLIEMEERHAPGVRNRVAAFFADLGYAGFFLQSGTIRPIAVFDEETMQDPLRIEGGAYINNFIFLPSEEISQVLDRIRKPDAP